MKNIGDHHRSPHRQFYRLAGDSRDGHYERQVAAGQSVAGGQININLSNGDQSGS